MATKSVLSAFKSFISWLTPPPEEDSTDDTPKICLIFNLPPELLQTITECLSARDIISLSRTCRAFHTLINDDAFWVHRIRCQFPQSIATLYTYDLFLEPELVSTNDEPRPSGFEHIRHDGELDFAAINSATHYNDEAIEKRHAKMYISKEDFLTHVKYFQFKTPHKGMQISFMKLMYFYLIDRKRTAAVNMDVIHRNNYYLVEDEDRDSLTGRIIRLENVCWLEITGRFEHKIIPGKYAVIWRMKSRHGRAGMWGETEFSVVPSHGKMLLHKVSDIDFANYVLEHGNSWFSINMGHIIVYELSKVFIGIRNWSNGAWKTGISWDCIELKPIP